MSYVPGAEHDVCVSYAHIDNEPLDSNSGPGWVDHLTTQLQTQLKQRLGSGEVDIWSDRRLALNMPLTSELTRQVSGAALLLVVMSPAYLNSDWCRKERNFFLEKARDGLKEGRVFIVNRLDIDPTRRPPEFGDHDGWKFWVYDREYDTTRTLGALDSKEGPFVNMIYALSAQMARVLGPLAAGRYRVVPRAFARETGPGTDIFLARSADDLEDREQDLRNHLAQAGLRVQPRRIYAQPSREDFESAVRAELQGCRLFVQLLSASRGSETPFEQGRRLPALLQDVARACGIPTLSWRDRALDPATISNVEHRQLVENAIACPIEEFKRMVVDEVRREQPPKRVPRVSVSVFVDRDRDDRTLAERVAQELECQGVSVYFPLDSGTPGQIRADMESSLRDADGVLLVFGAIELPSVREHLRQHTRVLSQRDIAPAALAVFEGPPGEREKLEQLRESCRIPDMLMIDGSGGVTPQQLAPFILRLREYAAHTEAK